MEVLGISKQSYSDADYICKVTHAELKKFLNVYYTTKNKDLEALKVGDVIDLAKGYDFCEAHKYWLKRWGFWLPSYNQRLCARVRH